MEKIRLEIFAISSSQAQQNAYALILGESDGKRKLPIIIGGFEAQSIAIASEKVKSTRPLTHDLFKNFSDTFGIKLKEIVIYKYHEGVFYAKLVCVFNNQEYDIDSRTSDAVALAVRFNCPIYTYDSIFSAAGIEMKEENQAKVPKKATKPSENKISQYNMGELKELLQKALENENYEEASKLRDEINKRTNS